MVNIELTCSDGEVLFATNNKPVSAVPWAKLSCPNGFDESRSMGKTRESGVNYDLFGLDLMEVSCEDDNNRIESGTLVGPSNTFSQAIKCPRGDVEKVVGIQVEEHDDSDGGIVRYRFVCAE